MLEKDVIIDQTKSTELRKKVIVVEYSNGRVKFVELVGFSKSGPYNLHLCDSVNEAKDFSNCSDSELADIIVRIFKANSYIEKYSILKLDYKPVALEDDLVDRIKEDVTEHRQWYLLSEMSETNIRILHLENLYLKLKLKYG